MRGVYLLHFDTKLTDHAQHYLGYGDNIETRVQKHGTAEGARIMQVAAERGISWTVARTWTNGTRGLERKLKNRHNHAQLCPICNPRQPKETEHKQEPTTQEVTKQAVERMIQARKGAK